jgi:hypothetical protein
VTNYLPQATYTRQKAALTRAVRKAEDLRNNHGGSATALEASKIVEAAVIKAVGEWNDGHYAWPDDWYRWQRALDDSRPWNAPYIDITRVDLGL